MNHPIGNSSYKILCNPPTFGMVMSGRSFTSTETYRFGYQNQEEDQEFWDGAVSYKYRIEDPRISRFFSVDPLAYDYPHNSPYAFSENRVIDGIELEGLEYQQAGKYYKCNWITEQDNIVSRYNLPNNVQSDYFQFDPPMDYSDPKSVADNLSPPPSDDEAIQPALKLGIRIGKNTTTNSPLKEIKNNLSSASVSLHDQNVVDLDFAGMKKSYQLGLVDENYPNLAQTTNSLGFDVGVGGINTDVVITTLNLKVDSPKLLFGQETLTFKVRSEHMTLEFGPITSEKIKTYVKMPNWQSYNLIRTDSRYGLGKKMDIGIGVVKTSFGANAYSPWTSKYR